MGSTAEMYGWARGCERPVGPGVYEVHYMGRRMLVNVKRCEDGELYVYGVPGHIDDGVPVKMFSMYRLPRTDDSYRTATSNLSAYDRAMSRFIAGLTALRTVLDAMSAEEQDVRFEKWNGSQFDACDLNSEIALSYEAVEDREGVERTVKERIGVWDHEDRVAIPLPSEGLGSPQEGYDVNGRKLEQ